MISDLEVEVGKAMIRIFMVSALGASILSSVAVAQSADQQGQTSRATFGASAAASPKGYDAAIQTRSQADGSTPDKPHENPGKSGK